MGMTIASTAFRDGDAIPRQHTEDGQDASPALAFSGVPAGTRELALIVDDPDAPRPQPWVHWVVYGLAPDLGGLPGGLPRRPDLTQPVAALQGKNSWFSNNVGYRGPAPPKGSGVHHYHFKLYALDAPLGVRSGLDKDALLKAMQGHVLAEAEVVGTYQR
jgi:Raf kinase inhibitor-like YbhB/YbcL family protein